jgi:hypothetical protein
MQLQYMENAYATQGETQPPKFNLLKNPASVAQIKSDGFCLQSIFVKTC